MVDKRKSPDYQELRGFIPISLVKKFKAVCKGLGQNINDSLEEAVREWINKQEQSKPLRHENLYQGSFSRATSIKNVSQEIDVIFSTLPTVATAIQDTLQNEEWGLKNLAEDTKIPVNRLKKLLSGDRATDEEIKKLAGKLVKFNGEFIDEEELVDMRLAEDIKQRQQRRELERQKLQQKNKKKPR